MLPTIRLGSRGDAVRFLQGALWLPIDGIFGIETEAAVLATQCAHEIDTDGIVGPITWGRLLENDPLARAVSPYVGWGYSLGTDARFARAYEGMPSGVPTSGARLTNCSITATSAAYELYDLGPSSYAPLMLHEGQRRFAPVEEALRRGFGAPSDGTEEGDHLLQGWRRYPTSGHTAFLRRRGGRAVLLDARRAGVGFTPTTLEALRDEFADGLRFALLIQP